MNTRKLFWLILFIVALIVHSGCSDGSKSRSNPTPNVVPTQSPKATTSTTGPVLPATAISTEQNTGLSAIPWRFYVLGIQEINDRPAREGWKRVSIDLATENITDGPLWFPGLLSTDINAKLVDAGDYDRDGITAGLGDPQGKSWVGWSPSDWKKVEPGFLIWPGFRVRFSFVTEVPQNQSPAKLYLTIAGQPYELDLQKQVEVQTPFGPEPASWSPKRPGEFTEIPSDVRVTISNPKTTKGDPNNPYLAGKTLMNFELAVENTGGYDLLVCCPFIQPHTIEAIYGFDALGNLGIGTIDAPNNPLPPGKTNHFKGLVVFNSALTDQQPAWVVICLKSNSTNDKSVDTEKCEIYQVFK